MSTVDLPQICDDMSDVNVRTGDSEDNSDIHELSKSDDETWLFFSYVIDITFSFNFISSEI